MKQSTKLLSILLSLVMLMSIVSVVGHAKLVKNQVQYNAIDGADLTVEQVASLALDALDKLLYDAKIDGDGVVELDAKVTTITLRLDSVDHLVNDLVMEIKNNGWFSFLKGLLGDLADLNFDAIDGSNGKTPVQRSGGDLNLLYALVQFLYDNKDILKKIVYGIGTSNGISLGSLVNGLIGSSLDSINDIVKDLPGFLTKMVFGALLYNETPTYQGSQYDPDSSGFSLPDKANTIDKILNTWIYEKLAKPVEFTRDSEGNKVFTPGTEVSKQYAALSETAARALTNVNTNSIIQILDNIAQIAYDEFGVPGINYSLKHVLMDIMGADALEIKASDFETMSKYAAAKAEYDALSADVDANYLIHDCFFSDGDNYYYSDLEERRVEDINGDPILDQDGKEQYEKTRTYYMFDISDANDFFELVDWDYDITGAGIVISDLVANNGSILGSLNSLIYTALSYGVNPDVFDTHDALTPNVTCVDDLWYDGGNEEINDNLLRTAKWVLVNFTKTIFGSDSVYWDAANDAPAADFVATVQDDNTDLIDLVAYIGLPLFAKYAMPQMVFPKNADGTYNFDDGLQVLEFGAAVIQELITDIAPYVNYTDYIYANGSFTSASGRTFANHTADEWIDLILNMGIDLGYYYLNGVTNFNTAIPAQSIEHSRWMGMLNSVVTWGADYIGGANAAGNRALGSTASNSVLVGLEPNTIANKGDALGKLNYVLNRILPLGFLCDLSGNGYDVDLNRVIDKVKALATDFDLSGVLAILGRNTSATDSANPNSQSLGNILSSSNVVNNVLKLAQRILYLVAGSNLLPNDKLANVATLLTSDNLKTVVDNLLTRLNERKVALLCNALPVVAQFVKAWGGEQYFGTPSIGLNTSYQCSAGALSGQTFPFTNGSAGVWRHYKDTSGTDHQDEQYKYKISTVKAYNFNGSNSSYMTIGTVPTALIDYGSSADIPFSIANVPTSGAIVRVEITYQVTDEAGNYMANGKIFKASKYAYLNYNGAISIGDGEIKLEGENDNCVTSLYGTGYLFNEDVSADDIYNTLNGKTIGHYGKDKTLLTNRNMRWRVDDYHGTNGNGITFNNTIDVKNKTKYDTNVTLSVNKTTLTNLINTQRANQSGPLARYSIYMQADGELNTYEYMIVVYNQKYQSKLISLLNDEANLMRTTEGYKTTGTAYANEILDTTPDADGLVLTNFSSTGQNPDGETVTTIDCATAWTTYTNALQAAFRGARQVWNDNSVYNFETLYKNLYTAAKDVEYLKKSATELAAEGGEDLSADIAAMKTNLNNVVEGFGGKRATDYAMYRWSRLTDARDDAESIINKQYNAHFTVPEAVYFPYTGIADEDLTAATFGSAAYKTYTLALRRAYTAAQMADRTEALKQAKLAYAEITKLDVYQANNMLTLMNQRLLPTTYTAANGDNAEKAFLANEISSATAEIGTTNTKSYTARSWARYTKALAEANTALTSGANKVMFDAKYELQCARNALKTVEEEADYTELEALMAQATAVLANAASYTNTDKDFGHVLAALGMDEVTKANGDKIQLFPNSASIVNEISYWADDQRKVDRASDALREALSKMRLTVTGSAAQVTGSETVTLKDSDGNTLKDDEDNDKTLDIAKIDAKKTVDQVKATFTNLDSVIDGKVVSLNSTYAISLDNSGAFTGTGSTLTFYKTVGGVNIPVATINLVVEADVNGDGILDALDARTVKLTSTDHAYLSGLYFIAANLNASSEGIDATDFSAVVNKVVASA